MRKTVSEILLNILKTYPKANIIPLVDGDVKRDCGTWEQGALSKVGIEYYVEGAGKLWFYSDGDHKGTLEDMGIEVHDNEEDVDNFESLYWKEGVFLYIKG